MFTAQLCQNSAVGVQVCHFDFGGSISSATICNGLQTVMLVLLHSQPRDNLSESKWQVVVMVMVMVSAPVYTQALC